MSHKNGRPLSENFKGGQWGPSFTEAIKIWNQDYYGRGVDSSVLEGTHEWDNLEAKKAKEKKDAWKAKQDAFTRRAIQAKADAAKRKAGVGQESWTDWFSKFFKSKE